MRIPTRQELALTYWGDGIAIIKIKERDFIMEKVDPAMRDFFICKYGLYKVDRSTEYRHNKQPMAFYISHGTFIPDEVVKNVEKYYYKRNFIRVKQELEKVFLSIKNKEYKSIYEIFDDIVDETQHHAVDLDTEKYLWQHRAYNPKSMRMLNKVSHEAKKGVDSLSPPPLAKILSLGMWLFAAIIVFAVISNGPKWARELVAYIEG